MRDTGGVAAVNAVLEEHNAGDLRIVFRREEHEPAVVTQVAGGLIRGGGRGMPSSFAKNVWRM